MEVRGMIEKMVEEILTKKEVHVMANTELAEELLEELKKRTEKPILVKVKGWQMLAVTESAKRKLMEKLGDMRRQDLKEIHEIEKYEKEIKEQL